MIHGNEQSLAEFKTMIKPMIQQMIPPDNTIEDNGKRYWYSHKHLANGSDLSGTNWYEAVAVPGGVCAAQLNIKNPATEAAAKQIVDMIGATKEGFPEFLVRPFDFAGCERDPSLCLKNGSVRDDAF